MQKIPCDLACEPLSIPGSDAESWHTRRKEEEWQLEISEMALVPCNEINPDEFRNKEIGRAHV